MEIKSGLDIWDDCEKERQIPEEDCDYSSIIKKWVALDDEIKEAIALYRHLKNHKEVQEAALHPGEPMCKICNITAKKILIEEPDLVKQKEDL